jgi:hypothetical protein
MPPLATRFGAEVDRALELAEAGEVARVNLPKQSTALREWRVPRLEALYEMAYLRIFVGWEVFLEEAFLRMMCGYQSSVYAPVFASGQGRCVTLNDAQRDLYAGQDFLLWHNPGTVRRRAMNWLQLSPHETVIDSNFSRIEWLAYVRHRVAHGSTHAKGQLDTATINLAGRRYPGASAGKFLRDWDGGSSPPIRWLQSIGAEFKSLASQISP